MASLVRHGVADRLGCKRTALGTDVTLAATGTVTLRSRHRAGGGGAAPSMNVSRDSRYGVDGPLRGQLRDPPHLAPAGEHFIRTGSQKKWQPRTAATVNRLQ